jgi:hypothetical protein
MDDSLFRVLTDDEAEQFRQWAREHFRPGPPPDDFEVWHPVVRAEWRRLAEEQEEVHGRVLALTRVLVPGVTE